MHRTCWRRTVGLARRLTPASLTIVLSVTGCFQSGPPIAEVSGKVTFQGQPVTEGVVNFVSESGFGARATLGTDGSYRLRSHHGNGIPLDNYKAVCLLDPTKLSPVLWESLADFVQQGGGLGLFLGRNARRGQLGESAPPQLLAGPLRWTSRNETFLRPVLFDHPLLNPLAAYTQSIPWSLFPVFKFWEFDKLADGAHVICSFANGDPAIVERNVGKGRVLTMTTPISDVAYRDPWNLLPTGPDAWPFIVLAGGMADYLSGAHDDLLNYQAGQNVVMRLAVPQQTNNYVLRLPTGESLRQSLAAASNDALITATSELGNYRLQAGGKQAVLDRGFSVNAASEISEVQRIPFAEIQQALGKDRVQFAQTTDEIEIKVGLGRVGRELFPWLIGAVALVLGAEHLLANRFYRSDFSQN